MACLQQHDGEGQSCHSIWHASMSPCCLVRAVVDWLPDFPLTSCWDAFRLVAVGVSERVGAMSERVDMLASLVMPAFVIKYIHYGCCRDYHVPLQQWHTHTVCLILHSATCRMRYLCEILCG
jgi:hypothetical protein